MCETAICVQLVSYLEGAHLCELCLYNQKDDYDDDDYARAYYAKSVLNTPMS